MSAIESTQSHPKSTVVTDDGRATTTIARKARVGFGSTHSRKFATGSPESFKILPLPISSTLAGDARCRFEIDQDRTTFPHQDIAVMAVLMKESEFVELLQHTLALLEVSWPRTAGALNLLQHKSNRSAAFSHIGQELGSNPLA